MSHMFEMFPSFNGDLSKWNVSSVTDMSHMFANTNFKGDISKLDVSRVTEMNNLFASSGFNGNISMWDVSRVKDMSAMFRGTVSDGTLFNGDISEWDVSRVSSMNSMFSRAASFNSDIRRTYDVSVFFLVDAKGYDLLRLYVHESVRSA